MATDHLPSRKKLTDLAGTPERVDLHIQGDHLLKDAVLKGVSISYLTRTWVGIVYARRGFWYEVHVPLAAVRKIVQRTRLRRRG